MPLPSSAVLRASQGHQEVAWLPCGRPGDGYCPPGSPQPRVRPVGQRGSAPRCQAAGAKCQVNFKEMAKTSPKTTPNHGYRLCRNQRKPRFVAERVFCSAFHNDVRCFGLSSKLGDSLQKKFWSSAQVLRNSFGVGEGTVLAF